MSLELIAVDVETTGLDPRSDRVIEIGAVRFDAQSLLEEYQALVSPGVTLPMRIRRLTGLSDADLVNQPPFAAIASDVADRLRGAVVVAHNARFDLGFLRSELERCGLACEPALVLDTVELAKLLLVVRSYRLPDLALGLGLDESETHRALADARRAARLAQRLLAEVVPVEPRVLSTVLSLAESAEVEWFFRQAYQTAGLGPLPPRERHIRFRPGPERLWGETDETGEREEPESVDLHSIAAFFSPDGPLSTQHSSYEHRPSQVGMAREVGRALNQGHHLLVEAGTGTGKSMAYLVAAWEWARRNSRQVVVATNTINLQEQLMERDLPLLSRAADEEVKCALVKGRGNYLCLRKWGELLARPELPSEERPFWARLAAWLNNTETGDRSELNLFGFQEDLWWQVSADSETCVGPKCQFQRGACFVTRCRQRASRAQIVVVNHSLLLTDLQMENLILPEYDVAIIDEAHNLEEAATKHLGLETTDAGVRRFLETLYRPSRVSPGLLGGLKLRVGRYGNVGEAASRAIDAGIGAVEEATEELARVFSEIRNLVEATAGEEENGSTLRLIGSVLASPRWQSIAERGQVLLSALRAVSSSLEQIAVALDELTLAVEGDFEATREDLTNLTAMSLTLAGNLEFLLGAGDESYVFWAATERRGNLIITGLNAAPINVGQVLQEKLFETKHSVILTSATLTVGGEFEYVKGRLGLERYDRDRLQTYQAASPFNYREQALVCLARDLPRPQAAKSGFDWAVREAIIRLVRASQGRALVLFTSHRLLKEVYYDVREELEAADIQVLAQSLDGSRTALAEELRNGARTVVFGASSFWEGVDIPGNSLSLVIIVRLPFWPPNLPVIEARVEDLKKRGLSPFYLYSVPQAVIRFKQGFGRLIRTRNDRGAVVILDPRLADRSCRYRHQFLASLPQSEVCMGDPEGLEKAVESWLRGERPDGLTSDIWPEEAN